MNDIVAWSSLALSILMLIGYEWRAHYLGRHKPDLFARSANAQVRVQWVWALSEKPGYEIVAVQALRNSLMSATISASTAALAVMGVMSITGVKLAAELPRLALDGGMQLRLVLEAGLVLILFASYICSAMSMRHFGHASFVMSMPVDSEERKGLNNVAAHHVRLAGILYSWGLRLFLMAAPMVSGIVHALAMPVVTALLLVALYFFDRPAETYRIST
ncbi:MAG TPA: DUF599 domain-containing protein [Ideonella sp.]|uniref:DUF599 domain-containing protein n=1 Tax=Ideonella sp. TaxID=1929293 RepID=UPI002B85BF5E|nr:DUF599 domain-containing protein [Ideonella sp.]HSI51622.1 DUF599 domain-containing protein [Ideonella sp.]